MLGEGFGLVSVAWRSNGDYMRIVLGLDKVECSLVGFCKKLSEADELNRVAWVDLWWSGV